MFSIAIDTTRTSVQSVTLGLRRLVETQNAVVALVVHPSRPRVITRIGISALMAVTDNREFEFLPRPLANSPVGECVGRPSGTKVMPLRFRATTIAVRMPPEQ